MRMQYQVVITALLAAAISGGWIWFGGQQEAEGSKGGKSRHGGATRVIVEPVDLKQERIVVRAVGTGIARDSADIHPSVDGEVVDVRFRPEQRVAKGQVLVRLDDDHQRLAVRLAEVALRKAKRDAARLRKLAKSGHATGTALDSAQTALETATVRYAQAKADLADRVVIAPFDGVIGLSDISVGDRVTDATMIATLDERSTLLVDFNLPEDYTGRINVGDPIAVRPSIDPERRIVGKIAAMDSRIAKQTRTLRIRAAIPNPDNSIRPGTSFEVEFAFMGGSYPSIAEVAVLWSHDGAYLWRANAGKAEKIFVKLVRRDKGRILVDGPLESGDLIVVEGVQGLRDGQKLSPRQAGESEKPKRRGKQERRKETRS